MASHDFRSLSCSTEPSVESERFFIYKPCVYCKNYFHTCYGVEWSNKRRFCPYKDAFNLSILPWIDDMLPVDGSPRIQSPRSSLMASIIFSMLFQEEYQLSRVTLVGYYWFYKVYNNWAVNRWMCCYCFFCFSGSYFAQNTTGCGSLNFSAANSGILAVEKLE